MGILSSLWLLIYTSVVVVLAYVRWFILLLWPLLLVVSMLALVGWFSRHLWLAAALAQISRWKIKRYQPQESHAALRFYIFHLQRMVARKMPARDSQQLLTDWLADVAQVWTLDSEGQDFADVAGRLLYGGENVEVNEIQQTATALFKRIS